MLSFSVSESPELWSFDPLPDPIELDVGAAVGAAILDLGRAAATDDSYFAKVAAGRIGADAGVQSDRSLKSQPTAIAGKTAANSPTVSLEPRVYVPLAVANSLYEMHSSV